MEMMVRTDAKGKRLWSFTVDEKILYEILCNCIAWKVIHKTDKPKDEVMNITVGLAENYNDQSDEDLNKINDHFVRAVFTERKRLGLKEYQTKDKGGA